MKIRTIFANLVLIVVLLAGIFVFAAKPAHAGDIWPPPRGKMSQPAGDIMPGPR